MFLTTLRRPLDRFRERLESLQTADRDSGVVAVVTAVLMLVLMGFLGFSVDAGHWYLVRQQTQKAADAAALAGVVDLPDDPGGAASLAVEYSGYNGYPQLDGTTSVRATQSATDPNRLDVTVTTTVTNFFTTLLGVATTNVSSTGSAQYTGPVRVGSPCNQFGNDPDATSATQSPACSGLAAGRFWANVNGAGTDKTNGDPFQSTVCSQATSDDCPGGKNTDYTPDGYYYNITIPSAGSHQIQLFDPGFVQQGQACGASGVFDDSTTAVNPFVTDATTRYASGNTRTNKWCTGDNGFVAGATMSTTYQLLGPDGGADPHAHPPLADCKATYAGYTGELHDVLDQSSPHYDKTIAQSFRRWTTLCSVTEPGTYILQVTSGPGNASNHFAIRAIGDGYATATVSGRNEIGLFTSDGADQTGFYLARVTSGNAGQTLLVRFFDVGDSDKDGTLTITPPGGGTVSCTAYDIDNRFLKRLDTCQTPIGPVYQSNLNGRWVTLATQIPANYSCRASVPTACWYRVVFDYEGATPHDVSTWTANIDGQAVRLVP